MAALMPIIVTELFMLPASRNRADCICRDGEKVSSTYTNQMYLVGLDGRRANDDCDGDRVHKSTLQQPFFASEADYFRRDSVIFHRAVDLTSSFFLSFSRKAPNCMISVQSSTVCLRPQPVDISIVRQKRSKESRRSNYEGRR
jgi:hypothetical protein